MFGPTIQGEGPSIGEPCMFLRLANCNLACTWCDTKYAWDWSKYDKDAHRREIPSSDRYDFLMENKPRRLVITGGEPMLQQRNLIGLIETLLPYWTVEIETAGTIIPISSLNILISQYNVSIKLSNSDNAVSKRIIPDVIHQFVNNGKSIFKFVVSDIYDFIEIDALVKEYGMKDVYIMPEGTTSDDINAGLRTLVPHVIERGYKLTTRLHTQIWGNNRGH